MNIQPPALQAQKWTGPRLDLPMKALIDRTAVDAEIASAAEELGGGTTEFRKAAVEIFARALAEGSAVARAALEDKGSGMACAAHLAYVEDELLRAIHACVVKYIVRKTAPTRLCVVAVGGYGRGTLAPGSDIDLLFLLAAQDRAGEEAVVESMLYLLWDLKQKVGHATRTVDECLRQAKGDMTIRTTLLECRFILGERSLLDQMLERFDHEVVRNTAPEFVAAK
jgi:[protein-PII] uridylyltransferase